MNTLEIILIAAVIISMLVMVVLMMRMSNNLTRSIDDKIDRENKRTQDKIDQIKQLVREGKTVSFIKTWNYSFS